MVYKQSENKKEYDKKYYIKNKEKIKERVKKWSLTEKGKKNRVDRQKQYYLRHTERLVKRTIDYKRKRLKIDVNFRLIHRLRSRVNKALKGNYKVSPTLSLIGITDIEFLWLHLEKTFKPGMTRENYGKWHIDHIIPCSSFDLTKAKEQHKCFHYTNLQALWAHENLKKSDNYDK